MAVARTSSLAQFELLLDLGADPCANDPKKPERCALGEVARAGGVEKMEIICSRRPLSTQELARAFKNTIPPPNPATSSTLAAFGALSRLAGPQSEPAQALALQRSLSSLRSRNASAALVVHGCIDFSRQVPDGSPWGRLLAGHPFDGEAREAANQAFDRSWAANSDKNPFFQWDSLGESAVHRAARRGNLPLLKTMEGWADFDALSRDGAHPLELAAEAQRAAAIGERLSALEEAAQLREALGAPPSIAAKGSRRF